jgi:hypothetical protein
MRNEQLVCQKKKEKEMYSYLWVSRKEVFIPLILILHFLSSHFMTALDSLDRRTGRTAHYGTAGTRHLRQGIQGKIDRTGL